MYTTNNLAIVRHAKYCYENYPTIVNLIPKDSKKYKNTLTNYANIDNSLAEAQLAIGQSSNMAQLCLSYTYNYPDKKYSDYVCILSVIAQCAIDNAKRKYAVDLPKEIAYISSKMDVDKNGYPRFWLLTKKDKRKARNEEERRKRDKANKDKIKQKINNDLVCPMNYLYDLKIRSFKPNNGVVPIGDLFIKHEPPKDRRKCKKVEEMIQKYSIDLYTSNVSEYEDVDNFYNVLQADFDKLVSDIRAMYISRNYADLMSWLINRAFKISGGVKRNINDMDSTTHKNKSLLIKVLYEVNPTVFLSCFLENRAPEEN